MEELRIKCPSCGIILDVRNSKNEAVKKIACPNCKKHLAVTFHDVPQHDQFVEIKMVQLADGSTKTIIRALTSDHVVKVNGQFLQKDDEVVLSVGDELQIDDKVSTFGKDSSSAMKKSELPSNIILPSESKSHWGIFALVLIAFFMGCFGWYFWNRQQNTIPTESVERDSVASFKHAPFEEKKVDNKSTKELKQGKEVQPVKTNINSLSNYELEKLAMSGDVDAQYQLGKRWVNKHDSVNVVKGIKYLKLAAQNGSSEARDALRKVYTALEQSARNGSATAGNILREQR